jgi:serine/threonine-protein kinase RsbW
LAATERIALRVPRDTFYLGLVRSWAGELARRVGFAADATAGIEMAVDEACSNAILHARSRGGGPPSCDIALDAVIDEDGLTVTILDGGEPFELERAGCDLETYFAAPQPGGLGVTIMRRFMDEVEFRHRPEVGNELRMRKRLVAAGAARG